MAHVHSDRVRETSATTGTGSLALAGAAPIGYRPFSGVLAVNDTCYYAISHQTKDEWEIGLGTYSATNTLARTTVLASSNSGSAVNFSAGVKDVFLTYPAAKQLTEDPLTVARGGTGATTLTANNVLLGNGTSAPLTVAPGTAGNVLTSNGTTWQSTAAAAGFTTAGAGLSGSGSTVEINTNNSLGVGSLALAVPNSVTNNGATIAGSSLSPVWIDGNGGWVPAGLLTGTWRNVSGVQLNSARAGLFIRIS